MTSGAGEPKSKTAQELLEYLCEGCPPTQLVFQEILATKVLEPVGKKQYKHRQKLILAEATPICAWFITLLLRCTLD